MAAPRNPKALKRLGSRVKELRVEKGLSQEALAFDAGIHVNHLSSLERGEANPSYLVLLSIAGILRVKVADLTDG